MDSMQAFQQRCGQFVQGLYPGEGKVPVFGEGMWPGPRLMLIGEAPGAQETELRRPFVGKAGKTLDAFLAQISLPRQALYIANAVKVRPVKVGAGGRLSNRPPTAEEVEAFRPWLMEEIALVAPRLIATLGNVPLRALTGGRETIGAVHAQVLHIKGIPVPVYPLYHPASLIYNRALTPTYEADMERLKELLAQMEGAL